MQKTTSPIKKVSDRKLEHPHPKDSSLYRSGITTDSAAKTLPERTSSFTQTLRPIPLLGRQLRDSTEIPVEVSMAADSLYSTASDTINYLFQFATRDVKSRKREITVLNWTTPIDFTRCFLHARNLAQLKVAEMTTAELSCKYAKLRLDEMDQEDREAFINGLSKLDFTYEMNGALSKVAHAVLENKDKKNLLDEITDNLISDSKSLLAQLNKTIAKDDIDKLVDFLKREWLPVRVFENFRIALLTHGRDCYSNLNNLYPNELFTLWNDFHGESFDHLITTLSRSSRTKDVANLLESRSQSIKAECVLRTVRTHSEPLKTFITNACNSPGPLDLKSNEWQSACGEIKNVRGELAKNDLIPKAVIQTPAISLGLIQNDRVALKYFVATVLNREEQNAFFSLLSIDDLIYLRVADDLTTPTFSTLPFQRQLDRTDRLIDSHIKRYTDSGIEAGTIENAKLLAHDEALQVVIEFIGEKLSSMISLAHSQASDIPLLYTSLYRQAKDSFSKLVRAEVVPKPTLEEGVDYPSGLILLGFIFQLQGQGRLQAEINSFATFLSKEHSANLRGTILHNQWIKQEEIEHIESGNEQTWYAIKDRFRIKDNPTPEKN